MTNLKRLKRLAVASLCVFAGLVTPANAIDAEPPVTEESATTASAPAVAPAPESDATTSAAVMVEPAPALDPLPPQPDSGGPGMLRLNFRDAPLEAVLDYMSKAAGFVVIMETSIDERVTVWSHQPVSRDEAVDLLNTILASKGYTAIRNERTLTIVSRDEARQRNLPVIQGGDPEQIPNNDEMVTQIIPVKYANVQQLIQNLDPLLPEYATLSANVGSNALILVDKQSNIRRVTQIIQALDTSISSISQLRVFPLNYSDATEIAKIISDIFNARSRATGSSSRGGDDRSRQMQEFMSRMRGGGGGPGGGSRGGGGSSSSSDGASAALQQQALVVAVADERTNSLVVSAPEETMPIIEDLIAEIDTVAEDITEIRVFALQNGSASDMAELITEVFASDSQSQGGRGGSSSQRGPSRVFGGPMAMMMGGGRSGGGRPSGGSTSERRLQEQTVVAVPDDRTNTVIVTAASETMPLIAQMVEQLDVDPAQTQRVYVYPLENANVEEIQEILEAMFQSSSSSRGSSRTGSSYNSSTRSFRPSSSSSSSSRGGSSSSSGSMRR